jgi:DNA-binding IclR family transcriptional regulator
MDCLEHIRQHPRCMQVSIAQALGKDPSQVSRATSKLLEAGLVGRDNDGRLVAK